MSAYYKMGGVKRILWLDILKTVAISAMILLHVSAVGLSEAPVGSFDWHLSNLFNSLCRFCVPVFIMISGSIFLSGEMPMKKYIKRLAGALLFWTVAYTLYAAAPDIVGGRFSPAQFVKSLCSPTHLWFLWMILPLYLAVPIFRAIVRDTKAMECFLLLWIAFGILVPALQHVPAFGPLLTSVVKQTHFFLVLEFGGYFILGYYLCNHSLRRIEKFALLYIGVGVLIAVAGTFLVSSSIGNTSELFLGYMFPTTFITSAGLFIFFKNHVSQWKMPPRMVKIVSFISVSSLGIYTVHMFFLAAFHKIGFTYAICNPIISIPVICIVTLLLSMGFAYIVKRFFPKAKSLI